jgi:polyhydroxybutyrate depolymerase
MRLLPLLLLTVGLLPAETRSWTVNGTRREALIFAPGDAATRPAPLVFVFHGHGGGMAQAARSFRLHELWPQAIVVYPQGLNTPGQLTDPEGRRAGWQATAGDQGGRDLQFFDAMLQSLRTDYRVDPKRIFSTGHSNGGGFTYLLWAHRASVLAAVAPSGAVAARDDRQSLSPKPALLIAGERDPLVKYEWQKQMIDVIRRTNGDQPVETYIYDGGHRFPPEAATRIVRFFQSR